MSFLNTKTKVTQTGNSLSIYTWYQKCLNYAKFWIQGSPTKEEGVPFIEGELGYKMIGWKDQFFLSSNGDLMVSSKDPDKYAIDSNGDLTVNVDFCGQPIV